MKFSICIPNYNYAHYVGETVASALAQTHRDLEVLVADNASTDASVAVIEGFGDPRVRVRVNRWNVGFAPNLDRACAGATGDMLMLVSSDDLMHADALATYAALFAALGDKAGRTLICAGYDVIDGAGARGATRLADRKFWKGAVPDAALGAVAGAEVLRMPARDLLRASLRLLRVPWLWLTMAHPRALYEAVEGYAAIRLVNPDKSFAWKLLTLADEVLFVQKPLFSYRIHDTNQLAVQAKQGALKHLVDQYINTFDTPAAVLEHAGVTRAELDGAFVEQDVGLRGLALLARGKRVEAARGVRLGAAAFPALTRANRKVMALRALLALGPAGEAAARRGYARALKRWQTFEEDGPPGA